VSTDNLPFGQFGAGDVPFFDLSAGIKTTFGLMLPPHTRVAAYLRSTGQLTGEEQQLVQSRPLVTTLASALKYCRAGAGDVVYVLPGHSESVTDATMLTNMVAGTRVIGMGDPYQDDAPTFRWTATTSQWAVAVKNCLFRNLRLQIEGAVVVKGINITAAGTNFTGNVIQTASGATNKATIAIEVGSGATTTRFVGNYIFGTETHNSTDVVKLVGATVPSDFLFANNHCIASATAGNGLVHVTVAALRCRILNNIIYNTHTASTACVAVDAVASDGVAHGNVLGTKNNGTVTSQGITFGAGALYVCGENLSVDEPLKSGVLTPVAAT
jgi:hypothetical protein